MKETLTALLLAGNAVVLVALFGGAIVRSFFKRRVHNMLGANTTPELDDAMRALHDLAHDHGVEVAAVMFNLDTGARAAVTFGTEACRAANKVRADLLEVAAGQLTRCSEQVRQLPEGK